MQTFATWFWSDANMVQQKFSRLSYCTKYHPSGDFHRAPCPRLFSKDHYEPSTFLRGHHEQSPHHFYPKILQSWGDSMELLTLLSDLSLKHLFFNISFFMSTSSYFSTDILTLFIEYQHTFPGYHFTLILLPLTFKDVLKSNCQWSTSTNCK